MVNSLFFNVLSNEFNNKLAKDPNATLIEWAFKPGDALRFRLNKRFDGFFDLIPFGNKVPFSYHLQLLFEIREAIKSDKKIECVFVKVGDKAKIRIIKTGIQDDANIEVLTGLKKGDVVITGPYSTVTKDLNSGDKVAVKTDKEKGESKK